MNHNYQSIFFNMKPFSKNMFLKQKSQLKSPYPKSKNIQQNISEHTFQKLVNSFANIISQKFNQIINNQNQISLNKKLEDLFQQQKKSNENVIKLTKVMNSIVIKNETQMKMLQKQSSTLNQIGQQNKQKLHEEKQINKQQVQDDSRMQSVFQNVDIPIPQDKGSLYQWLGKVCKSVFSIGFNLFKGGQITESILKAFCSQNIIRNLIYFSRKHQLKKQDVSKINENLKQLLQYFLTKYPESQTFEANNKFSNQLIERDLLNENEYDMVYKSGVKFNFQESGNYNSQIMEFLNYIINLPNKQLENKDQKKKNKTYNSKFRQEMVNIFQKVYSEKELIDMQKYNPKEQKKQQARTQIENKEMIISATLQNNITTNATKQVTKKQYQQKVKAYTSFLIGQKISQNFEVYEKQKIDSGLLSLKSSAMMRVVTKWCQQLSKCFDEQNIIDRESPFKLKNGSQKYFDKHALCYLNYLLQSQKSQMIYRLNQIQNNNYKCQSQFMKAKPQQQMIKYSEEEVIVGQFASAIYKNNENYLINYLNMLIHGINKATLKFKQYLSVVTSTKDINKLSYYSALYLKYNPEDSSVAFSTLQQQISQQFKKSSRVDITQLPQLITFKIGDLLRCKCSSKQRQIIAIYKYVEKLSAQNQNELKIIRVKNRLNKANKDILMNLLFKNTILIEMQLNIKEEKSKFIQYSGKFNHYIYELKRAQFGPITEMCTIWMSKDFRAQFYLQKMEKLNKRQKQKNKLIQCCKNKMQAKNVLPFQCRICKCFYYENSQNQKHIYCKSCESSTCFLCQFEHATPQIRQNMISYPPEISLNKICIFDQIPPNGGIIVKLQTKNQKYQQFHTWISKNKQQYYLFSYDPKQNKVVLIDKVNKKDLGTFLKHNIIYTAQQITNSLINPYKQKAKQLIISYFSNKVFKDTYKSKKKSLSVVNRNLNQKQIEECGVKQFPEIKKLNLSSNKQLINIKILINKFPNIEFAVLNDLSIKTIPETIWRNLKVLQIQRNKLQNIEFITDCLQIEKLNLSQNNISNIPQGIGRLKKLIELQISHNMIENLNQNVGNLKLLKKLNLSGNNNLKQLPKTIGKLYNLQELRLLETDVPHLPKGLGALKNLIVLQCQQLDQTQAHQTQLAQLQKLIKLNLQKCKIKKFPNQLSQLRNLKILTINCLSQLESFPQCIGEFQTMQKFQISNCQNIKTFSIFFNNLIKMDSIIISNCPSLEQMKQSFNKLQELQKCQITECHNLKSLPSSFNNIKQMINVKVLQCYQLINLSQFSNLHEIQQFILSYCKKIKILSNFLNKLESARTIIFQKLQSLTAMQESFSKLKKTEIIVFQKCLKLKQMKKCFNSFQQIPRLPVQICSNYELCFNQVKKIQSLTLENVNNFKAIKSFKNLKYVDDIVIANVDYLSEIVKCFKINSYQKIGYISLTNIQQKQFTNLFTSLKYVHCLRIYNCKKLKMIKGCFKQLLQMEQVQFNDCDQLSEINDSFLNLRKLKAKLNNCKNLGSQEKLMQRFIQLSPALNQT